VVLNANGITYTNNGTITGGTGGAGGTGLAGSAGAGGDAGHGLLSAIAGATLDNTGSITGGSGGASGGSTFQEGGNGGAGVTGTGLTVTNTGVIIGGNGGTVGVTNQSVIGFGGAGISGSNLTISNGGSIAGGLAGDGVTQANAITFTGGTNSLTLLSGSTISGNVVAFSNADSLILGGDTNATFNASSIGATAQYQGFGIFQKTGASDWTLTGSTSAATAWNVINGTLTVAGAGALGTGTSATVSSGATLNLANVTVANPLLLAGNGFAGAGALTGTGTAGASGTITLLANTLIGTPNAGDTLTISGTISGAFALSKNGNGTLIINSTNDGFTGVTSVNAGTLQVGDISHASASLGGDVSVNTGATLLGHGTIGGNVTNTGSVQPGGTIGILTVAGNYTQAATGNLTIEITPNAAAGPGVGYSQLSVGGSAVLAGGLTVLPDAGTYTLGSRYTVLTAAGGRSGTFATVSYNPALAAFITPVVSYDANDVFLTLDATPSSTASAPAPLVSGGQQAPDALTAIVSAVEGVGDAILSDVCAPTARNLQTSTRGCDVHDLTTGFQSEVWMHGLGGLGNLTGGSRTSFSDSYGGVLIGAGIRHDGFSVGAGGGYLATSLNVSGGGDAQQNAGLGFVYGRYAKGPLQLGITGAYGGGTVDGQRSLAGTGLTATGNRAADFSTVRTRAAYDFALGAFTIEPRADLAYIHAGQSGFSESGAGLLDLTYAGTNTDVTEGQAIIRAMRRVDLNGWGLEPWVEGGVRQIFSGLSRGAVVTDGAITAGVSGVSPASTAGVVGIGVSAAATDRLNMFVLYQGSFSSNQTENAFSGGVAMRF
jgi:uncharacterized protein with beta-barrel porin domain